MRSIISLQAKAAALNYLFIILALLGLPINETTLILGDLTISKPNSRTHEVGPFGSGACICIELVEGGMDDGRDGRVR